MSHFLGDANSPFSNFLNFKAHIFKNWAIKMKNILHSLNKLKTCETFQSHYFIQPSNIQFCTKMLNGDYNQMIHSYSWLTRKMNVYNEFCKTIKLWSEKSPFVIAFLIKRKNYNYKNSLTLSWGQFDLS